MRVRRVENMRRHASPVCGSGRILIRASSTAFAGVRQARLDILARQLRIVAQDVGFAPSLRQQVHDELHRQPCTLNDRLAYQHLRIDRDPLLPPCPVHGLLSDVASVPLAANEIVVVRAGHRAVDQALELFLSEPGLIANAIQRSCRNRIAAVNLRTCHPEQPLAVHDHPAVDFTPRPCLVAHLAFKGAGDFSRGEVTPRHGRQSAR